MFPQIMMGSFFRALPTRVRDTNDNNNNNNNTILLVRNISNYISFPPQIAYKLIEAGRSRDILQIHGFIYRWTK